MADKIRVGIVGANVHRGWAPRAHVPALKALPEFELKAVSTTRRESADEAAKTFGADLAFDNNEAMFQHPDVDLITVSVKVPSHHAAVMGALKAKKNVYCEWPLGANLREAEEMASLARQQGVTNLVGLQGRTDPSIRYLKELIESGYVGDVLAVNMTAFTAGAMQRTSDRIWQADKNVGANTLTIAAGHAIDCMCYALGEFAEVSAKLGTQIKQWRASDTGETVDVTSPDNILIAGVLESGALASVHVASIPHIGSPWRLEVHGRDGTIFATSGSSPNVGPVQLVGSKGGEALVELQVPDRLVLAPEGTPKGSAFNVAQMYIGLADAMRSGQPAHPGFDDAVQRHKLIDAMQRASDEGRRVKLS
jgi:predicted dehydrogenase